MRNDLVVFIAVNHARVNGIDRHGGGVWKGRKAKGAIPGGISMGVLTEKELDIPLDFNGPGTVGCLVAWLAARTAGSEVELVDVDSMVSRHGGGEVAAAPDGVIPPGALKSYHGPCPAPQAD